MLRLKVRDPRVKVLPSRLYDYPTPKGERVREGGSEREIFIANRLAAFLSNNDGSAMSS